MVSVFLLSWNHEKYIEQAVRSILSQTYKEIEVVFVDNNSSDNSFNIALQIFETAGISFKAFKREKDYNIAANLNYLLSKSGGQYICILSADDWVHKDNILMKMKPFDSNPKTAMVYSGGYKYYDEIDIYEPFNVISFPEDEILQELLKRNFISGIGCIIRKSVLVELGGWNESFLIEDGDMWVKIVSKYKITALDKYLFFYRQHPGAFSSDPFIMLKAKMEWLESNRLLNKYPKITYRNNIDNYLSKLVLQKTSVKVLAQVLHHFRFNRLYMILVIKSLLPLKWKQTRYKRGLVRRYGKIVPDA